MGAIRVGGRFCARNRSLTGDAAVRRVIAISTDQTSDCEREEASDRASHSTDEVTL